MSLMRSWSSMRACLRTFVILAGAALLPALASTPSAAAPSGETGTFDATTQGELQGIITKQLSALGRDDAKEAESFASPQLRERYPDPLGFLAMVKENYAPLLKPRSTHFDEISDSPHGPVQKMTLVADDGTVWTVVYAFERVGGEWRISGCGLMKQESQDI